MNASVVVVNGETEPFGIEVEVKQRCVMAPVIFNLYLDAATHLIRTRVSPGTSVDLTYRLDGSLFKMRRLKSASLTTELSISELQYADDCVTIAHSLSQVRESPSIL